MSGASLKMTYSPLQKRLPFCRSVYVKKVMKQLAFIFEQPSYTPKPMNAIHNLIFLHIWVKLIYKISTITRFKYLKNICDLDM